MHRLGTIFSRCYRSFIAYFYTLGMRNKATKLQMVDGGIIKIRNENPVQNKHPSVDIFIKIAPWWVQCRKQKMLILLKHISQPITFVGFHIVHFIWFCFYLLFICNFLFPKIPFEFLASYIWQVSLYKSHWYVFVSIKNWKISLTAGKLTYLFVTIKKPIKLKLTSGIVWLYKDKQNRNLFSVERRRKVFQWRAFVIHSKIS